MVDRVGAPYRVLLYQPGIRFILITNSKVLSLQHLLPPATSNFSSLIPLSSIFLYIQLLVHYSVTRLLPLSIPHLLVHILFSSLILDLLLSATHFPITPLLLPFSFPLLLTTSSFLLLTFFIFSNNSTSGFSTITSCMLQIQLSLINI